MSLSPDVQEAFRAAVKEVDTINGQELLRLQERVRSLFDAIAHGNQAHRDWLKKAVADHFAGAPVVMENKPDPSNCEHMRVRCVSCGDTFSDRARMH